jgi:hypothetical protein
MKPTSWELSSLWPPPSTSLAAGHLHLPLSLLRGLLKGLRRLGISPPLHAVVCGVSRFRPTPSTSAILARSGIPEVIVIAVRVRVRGVLQDLHDLEVGYVVFIVNGCAGA